MTIEEAWYLFETHARACETCKGPLRRLLGQFWAGAGPAGAVADTILAMCPDGQERAAAWDHLCSVALGRQEADVDDAVAFPHILEQRHRLQLDGDGDEVHERIAALAQLSGEAFIHLLQLPPERRQAAIEAVVLTYRRTGDVRAPEPGPAGSRTCRKCGTRIRNPNHELCNDCWRAQDKAERRRPTLIPDDD